MVQEEQSQRCSTSSSGGGCGGVRGGRTSKKLKQKKVPQRGLGVEKLEKIRLEEQRKNGVAARPVVVLPFMAPSPAEPPATSTLYRTNSTTISAHHPDFFVPPPLLATNSTTLYSHNNLTSPICGSGTINGSVLGWSGAVTDSSSNCLPSTWNFRDLEPPRMDSDFTIGQNSQSDLRLSWPYSVTIPREQQHQQFPSLVNVCSSTSSSSGLNLQMEPPSNQSCYSNYGPPFWSVEERMVGMKRPWPFSLDNPPGPSTKFQSIIPNFHGQDESSSSCGNMNIGTPSFYLGNVAFREAHSSSAAPNTKWKGCMLELKQNKSIEENGALDGNSLTLGLSSTTTLPPPSTTSKSKQPLSFPPSHYPQFNVLPSQGGIEDPLMNPGSSVQERPIYSFFPPKKQQIGPGMSNERRAEAGNDVDLTLKL